MIDNKLLLNRIKSKKAAIGVIGLGYVGLPLALSLVKNKFHVYGFVRSNETKKKLIEGASNITDDSIYLKSVIKNNKFIISTSSSNLKKCDIIIICVPTPVTKSKKPDLTNVKDVAAKLAEIDLTNKLIINESTVSPFTTRTIFGKLLGEYFLVCSPERIDPGTNKTVESIPKVIGGINSQSLELGVALYDQLLEKKLVKVKSLEAAEMTKMLENTYRAVNIALINEFAKLADAADIDILDVISAASSKWSFAPHYPGLGVGGHCIPVDPYYILQFAKKKNINMNIIRDSLEENESMPYYLMDKIKNVYKKDMNVVVYGLTYKKNVADLRESPVLILCNLLKKNKINFTVYDPLLHTSDIKKLNMLHSRKSPADLFIVGTDHAALSEDYKIFINNSTIVIDGRNYFSNKVGKKIIGIGRGSHLYEKIS